MAQGAVAIDSALAPSLRRGGSAHEAAAAARAAAEFNSCLKIEQGRMVHPALP
jgi:hypothetical protein